MKTPGHGNYIEVQNKAKQIDHYASAGHLKVPGEYDKTCLILLFVLLFAIILTLTSLLMPKNIKVVLCTVLISN